ARWHGGSASSAHRGETPSAPPPGAGWLSAAAVSTIRNPNCPRRGRSAPWKGAGTARRGSSAAPRLGRVPLTERLALERGPIRIAEGVAVGVNLGLETQRARIQHVMRAAELAIGLDNAFIGRHPLNVARRIDAKRAAHPAFIA